MMKEIVNNDGYQFHQYRQNEKSPLILTELTEHKKTLTYDVGNSDPGLEQAQTWFWNHSTPLLKTGFPTEIHTQTIDKKKTCTDSRPLKMTTYYHRNV